MMIYECYARLLKGMQYGSVEFQQCPIFPKGFEIVRVKPQLLCNQRQLIIAILIGQVARSNLCEHVIPIERRGGVVDTADFEHHISYDRQCMPAHAECSKPGVVGVNDVNFQYDFFGPLEETGITVFIHQEGQKIILSLLTLPAERLTALCKCQLLRISDNAIVSCVGSVAN